jgi:DNA-binding LytR/AlgR family response regulator
MEKLLALKLRDKASMFIRVGRRYIINRNFIYMVSPIKQRLVLSDFATFAYQLDVSKDALSRMKSLLTEISKQK